MMPIDRQETMIEVFGARLRLLSSRIVIAATVLAIAAFGVHLPAFAQGSNLNPGQHWVGTWAMEPNASTPNTPTFTGQTLRQIVHISIGGEEARLRFSNFYGTKPLVIGAAHVALRRKNAAIVPASDRTLTFSGKPSVTIPPGALVVSDPVKLTLPPLSDVAVSLYLPGTEGGAQATVHASAKQTNYVSSPGDYTGAAALPDAWASTAWFYLVTMEVAAPEGVGAVAVLGDSISDCSECIADTNTRWPDFLAARLLAKPVGLQMGVLNESIGGGRLLHDGNGYSALHRLDRDLLEQPGVTHVIVYLGINDIGKPTLKGPGGSPGEDVTADDLIAGMKEIVKRAHSKGIKVIGATLTPFENTTFFDCCYYSQQGEATRQAFNAWIRTTHDLDGAADFEKAVRDPSHPTQWLPLYDEGDHLHSGPEGGRRMADNIDLRLLQH